DSPRPRRAHRSRIGRGNRHDVQGRAAPGDAEAAAPSSPRRIEPDRIFQRVVERRIPALFRATTGDSLGACMKGRAVAKPGDTRRMKPFPTGIRQLALLSSSVTLLACGDGTLLTVGHVAQRVDGGSVVPPPPQRDADTSSPESSTIGGCPTGCQSCPAGTKTTISGTVYDPAGKVPLYNVIVYVPKTSPVERPQDKLTCDTCAGTVRPSGNAIALSDFNGAFLLEQNVPVGTDVPLVIQIGKWQREIHVPKV